MARYRRRMRAVLSPKDQAVYDHLERARRSLQAAEAECREVLEARQAAVTQAQQTLRDVRNTLAALDRVRTLSPPYWGGAPGVTDAEVE